MEKERLEVLGQDHPDYLTTKSNLANSLDNKGQYDEAIAIYEEIQKARLELHGEKHRDYLTSKYNLAGCLRSKGKCT